MVLDIRHLRFPEEDQEGPAKEETKKPDLPAQPDLLEQLLEQAACAPHPWDQIRAVEQLRQLVPGAEDVDRLWEILADEADPRRLAAAQMLGFHRQWLTSRSRLKQLLDLARRERNGKVGQAMVWCLRQRNEIGEFLRCGDPGMVREAALGLPVDRQTLPHLLDAFLKGLMPGFSPSAWSEIDRILLEKLHGIHPSLVRDLIELLLREPWEEPTDRLVSLFERLPQLPLFGLFVEERHAPGWDPGQAEDTSRSIAWRCLGRVARQVMERAPHRDLLRHLLARSSEDATFARRHARFLKAVMRNAKPDAALISHFERLTSSATEAGVARLAQLLVELSDRLGGEAGAQATALLERWKNLSPDLKLKIYHMQHGLGRDE